jgi:hypothetical protein
MPSPCNGGYAFAQHARPYGRSSGNGVSQTLHLRASTKFRVPHFGHFLKKRGGTLTNVHTAMIASMIVTYNVADTSLEASVGSSFTICSDEDVSGHSFVLF